MSDTEPTEIETPASESAEPAPPTEPPSLPSLAPLPELADLPQLANPTGSQASDQPAVPTPDQPIDQPMDQLVQPAADGTSTGPVWQPTFAPPMGQPGWPAGASMNQPPVNPQWAQWAAPAPAPNPYANPYQNPQAYPYANPYQQPPRKSSKTGLIVALVGLMVVALVVVGVFAFRGSGPKPGPTTSGPSAPASPASPSSSSATSNPPGPAPTIAPPSTNSIPDFLTMPKWSVPLEIGWPEQAFTRDIYSAGVDDVVILTGTNYDKAADLKSDLLAAVDLATMKVLWTTSFDQKYSGDAWLKFHVDSQGVVVETQGSSSTNLQIINPLTGEVAATTDLPRREMVAQVVSGMVITDNGRDYCVRTMTAPSTCQQIVSRANYMSTSIDFQPVFAGGRLINTDRGVYDLSTGKPATFGSDAHGYSGDKAEVRYAGDSLDRIFRVECSTDLSSFATACKYQPWDTVNNKALGQAVEAGLVAMASDGSSFVGVKEVAKGSFQAARYTWPDASAVWQGIEVKCADTYCPLDHATVGVTGRTFLLYAGMGVQAILDMESGAVINVDEPDVFRYPPTSGFGGQQVVYLGAGRNLLAYDGASGGFNKLWALKANNYMSSVTAAGNHIVGVGDMPASVMVLQPK